MNKFIIALLGYATYQAFKSDKPTIKRIWNKQAKLIKEKSPECNRNIPESCLPDYPLNGKLNKWEEIYLVYLDWVKKKVPQNQSLIVKQREPVKKGKGRIERGYLVKQMDGNVYQVIPKIKNLKTLTTGIHETCHFKLAHHDRNRIGYNKSLIQKELEANRCTTNLLKIWKINWTDPRTLEELKKLYGEGGKDWGRVY